MHPGELSRPLKIHIYSQNFAPSIGGLERLIEILASQFHRLGHAVSVSTETAGHADTPYPVFRRPGARRFAALCREADVILSAPLSLRRLPLQLTARRPICVAHPAIFEGAALYERAAARIKWRATRLVTNIVPSRFVGQAFAEAVVIANPFDESAFRFPPSHHERSGIIFAGRFAPGKGCTLLVEAFARIADARPRAHLTFVGEGPEEGAIRRAVAAHGLQARVSLEGPLRSHALAATMQRHAVMVVPSVCDEAFGIVAIEGLACGCRMVVSRVGGLPEAVGPHALYFERGDIDGLAAALRQALYEGPPRDHVAIRSHLEQFRPEAIARQYLAVMTASVRT